MNRPKPVKFVVVLQAPAGDPDPTRRLRQFLKWAGRSAGLRCVKAEQEQAEPHGAVRVGEGAELPGAGTFQEGER